MTINSRIKTRRAELDMTLEDVAKVVGVTRATIQKYENSIISTIPYDRIESLAKALNTTPAWLMGWDDPETEKQPSESGELSEAQKELIEAVRALPDETCRAVLLVLRGQSPPDAPDGQ